MISHSMLTGLLSLAGRHLRTERIQLLSYAISRSLINAHHTSVCSSHVCSINDSPIIRLTSVSSTSVHWLVTVSHSEPDLLLTYIY